LAFVIAGAIIAAAVLTSIPVPFTSKVINPGAPPGTLSILLTDPPAVPEGVASVYLTYKKLGVHITGLPSESGWTEIDSVGPIETLGLVNLSLTISSVKVPNGQYDRLRFNLSSATTTFLGRNYSTYVRNSLITMPIIGGIQVNASGPVATLIDIQPTILNIGTRSAPQFVITAAANALPVPNSRAPAQIHQVGYKMPLQAQEWYSRFVTRYTSRFQLSSVTLTRNSVRISVKSISNSEIALRLVAVLPATVQHNRNPPPPQTLSGSAIFEVQVDEGLKLLQVSDARTAAMQVRTLFAGPGYNLAPGASADFTYSGVITSSFPTITGNTLEITPGGFYTVIVIGDQTITATLVTAG